ncbi:ABC transporter substrate-binding protein [Bradyrhizobium sp. NP1]|uniref:ABC transporter substrate-binding protein n=1 Tax=Bradyrhizobium sp. NP1 TaxID=3049772 RepID=UPI0025A61B1F|nr:ABC transporter substrate-binding protein [Bradyrhizobium sp. NP1]WJR77868.1 ABC transporter substrate-binding protein [Bradyrhizobium sp. NP1]
MSAKAKALFFALLVLASSEASAQTRIKYLLTSPSPNVAEAAHSSVPERMGYWKQGGLDVEVTPFSGSTGATQLVIAGSAQFTMASPEALLVARQEGAPIKGVYNHVREPIYTIAVVDDSPVKKLDDLKGKTIGVLSLSSGATAVAKAMLRSIGLDPEKDARWLPIGLGPQAANALKANQVDAIAMWDWAYAILENSGFRFRHFETPQTASLLSLMLITNDDFLKTHREDEIKFAQGIAKGAVFALANPEAAVRIHWEKYPASKPTNISEEQALKEAVHVLQARLSKYKVEGRADPRLGAFTRKEWESTQGFFYDVGMINKKPDVSEYFTNDLVDEINKFDKAAVIKQAETYR